MIKITEERLIKLNVCSEGLAWFKAHKQRTLKTLVSALIKEDHVSWANWLIVRLMTHPQQVLFAVYAAEQAIKIFEKKHPQDKRPRQAIQAAKDFLAGKISTDAAYAAADAANTAAYAAAAYAAYAAYAAADAAYAAYAAAYAADAATYAAKKGIVRKTLAYGLQLLGE